MHKSYQRNDKNNKEEKENLLPLGPSKELASSGTHEI